jgi:exo-beta-1,3-glucanase (GH17 family)
MDGTLRHVPRLARALGFTAVIAGLYWYDDAQLARERVAALAERAWVEGFVLGNEGLLPGATPSTGSRPRSSDLRPRAAGPSRPASPVGASRRTVDEGVAFVEAEYRAIAEAAPGRTVVLKEVWWPSAGDPAATPDGQAEFFRRLRRTDLPFVFGAAYDASWNTAEGPVGQHWGLHAEDGAPKPALVALQREWLWSLLAPAGR